MYIFSPYELAGMSTFCNKVKEEDGQDIHSIYYSTLQNSRECGLPKRAGSHIL